MSVEFSFNSLSWDTILTIYALAITSPWFWGIMGVAVMGALIAVPFSALRDEDE